MGSPKLRLGPRSASVTCGNAGSCELHSLHLLNLGTLDKDLQLYIEPLTEPNINLHLHVIRDGSRFRQRVFKVISQNVTLG